MRLPTAETYRAVSTSPADRPATHATKHGAFHVALFVAVTAVAALGLELANLWGCR